MTWVRTAVDRLAAEWAAVLEDTVTITDPATGRTYNPVTRSYSSTPATVYTGVALVRPRGAGSTDYGEQQVELIDYDIYLPPTASGIKPDQQLTVDTVATTSPELAGQTMTVMDVEADSFNARLRVGCQLNRGGGAG